jgi:phenylacetate-CoA ligase
MPGSRRARPRTWLLRLTMPPLDWTLQLIAENYRVFVWFFRLTPGPALAWLGRMRAIRASDAAARKVPAYREFLASREIGPREIERLAVPAMDKQNYIREFGFANRCVGGVVPTRDVAIDESSGSTGTPYNWIRCAKERRASHLAVSHFARHAFGTHPWITINAFSMGAWATGINMGIALQRNSIVKNTGPDLGKILGTLDHFGPDYRYLICGYPPFLKQLIDLARERQFPLEQFRLMALLGGEGNSEGLRDYLSSAFERVFSGYGATDIEIGIAGETPLSVALRRAARQDRVLRSAIFGSDSRLPMLFQYNPLMHHIEVDDHELHFTVTRLNVLSPRIRYNIHDEGGVATFADVRSRCENAGVAFQSLLGDIAEQPVPLPFLWVYGRSDSTISVMGANIYPEDLEQCLYDEPELAKATRSFCLGVREGASGTVRPHFAFEVCAPVTPEFERQFAERIVTRLVALNADFREAMKESCESATPIVELFAENSGPFQADAGRIKQIRLEPRTSD